MARYGAIAHMVAVCLAASGWLCVQAPAQHGNDGDLDFRLVLLNDEPVVYSLTSPTDGDILDRGFLARTIIVTLRSNYGEAVVCTDRLGVELARAVRESCSQPDEETAACFTIAIDTRRLPNGPNRLFFRLYDAFPSPQVNAVMLGEIRLVVNVLNPRIEVDARNADGVRLRLEAGVASPGEVKNFRFAVFAGREPVPSKIVPGYNFQGLPLEVVAPVGPDAIKVFPRSEKVLDVPWPEGSPSVYLYVNRATLADLSGASVPKPVYFVLAIYDGTAWHWTSVCEVALPAEGEGKGPALFQGPGFFQGATPRP